MSQSARILGAFVLSLLFPGLAGLAGLAGVAGAAESLDPLRGLRDAVAAYERGQRDPAESRRLADWLGDAEATAAREEDGARRAGLAGELASLRARLGAASVAAKAGDGVASARIEGVVRAAASGAPVQYTVIDLFDPSGAYVSAAVAGPAGTYFLPDLPPGTYFLTAHYYHDGPGGDLAPQLWRQRPCPPVTCQVTEGDPIVLAAGQTFQADFHLERYGKVEGTVRAAESGQPLAGYKVRLHALPYQFVAAAFTDASGHYSIGGIPAGQYHVSVADSEDRPGMVYPAVVCPSSTYDYTLFCNLAAANAVTVTDDETLSGIDFALVPGAIVSGRVKVEAGGVGIADALVYLDAPGSYVYGETRTDAGGFYRIRGLAAGSWRLRVAAPGFVPQAYRGYSCLLFPLCPTESFDPVATTTGQETSGIDFALRPGGRATGRVIDAKTGAPLHSAFVIAYSPAGDNLGVAAAADEAGFFTLEGLPEGEMLFQAEANGYQAELFDEVDPGLGWAAGTRVTVRSGETTPGIDFSLAPFGSIFGRVAARDTGTPFEVCSVFARRLGAPANAPDAYAPCGGDGTFTLPNLPPGSYRLWVAGVGTYAGHVLGVGSCNMKGTPPEPNCDLGGATALTVTSGETTQAGQLLLEQGILLAGNVQLQTDPGGNGGNGPVVRVYDAGGRQVAARLISLWDQDYGVAFLAPGTYRLVLDGRGRYVSKAWNSSAVCSRWYCDPFLAQPVTVAAGGSREGLDFYSLPLAPYTRCSGSDTAICLQGGRYKVETTWHDFLGQSGPGKAVRVTDESAYFWFFDPGNVELMVKALNACTPELGLHFWIFASGLTNVEVELKVTDTLTGEVRTYGNPSGQVIAPILDVAAFATCSALESGPTGGVPAAAAAPEPADAAPETVSVEPEGVGTCVETPQSVCLAGGRFQVYVQYQVRPGEPVQGAHARRLTGDTGAFDFFSPENIELMVKVLDACDQALPGYWIFAAGLTDVKADIQVLDTQTGQVQVYPGGFGPFPSIFDLGTFAASCG